MTVHKTQRKPRIQDTPAVPEAKVIDETIAKVKKSKKKTKSRSTSR